MTGFGPIETFTVPQYLAMHSSQSILYRVPKIYNDAPMQIRLLNNPESFKYNLKLFYCYNMYNFFKALLYFFR